MKQVSLGGKTKKERKKEKSLKKKLEYCKSQVEELHDVRLEVLAGNFKAVWVKKWWYCNHIKGYPEPPEDLSLGKYEHKPTSQHQEEMRTISEADVEFDKEYALERLEIAISNYEEKVDEVKSELQKMDAKW